MVAFADSAKQASVAIDTLRYFECNAWPTLVGGVVGSLDLLAPAILPGWRMPASLVRFNISALIATISVLPDMEIAAASGLNTNGYNTPADSGNAIAL